MKFLAAVVGFGVVALGAGAVRAQELSPPEAPKAWGTGWSTINTISAWSFAGPLTEAADGYRTCGGGPASCRASVNVDGGSFVWSLDIEACDSSPTSEAVARLWICPRAPGQCTVAGEVRTGVAEAPGCARVFAGWDQPYPTVNNWNETYMVEVFGSAGSARVPVDFRSVRVMSIRQVSPPPPTATFSDVPPSHPYFRHIEAVAGALISGGCGNGQFCPDRALTRGEMAVLLAEALGLHFPD